MQDHIDNLPKMSESLQDSTQKRVTPSKGKENKPEKPGTVINKAIPKVPKGATVKNAKGEDVPYTGPGYSKAPVAKPSFSR